LFSNWNTETYVLIGPDYTAVPPAKGPALSSQDLKSAVELPWNGEVSAERRLVRGRSWSPYGKISKVEYSLDQGNQWRTARLREPNIAAAWVRWDFEWEPKPGKQTIRVRATDDKGNTQPDKVPFNQQGYLNNAMVDHPIEVK
ncbi:MAG TPA: oxidoreductase, partial [Candidatus Binatia bacterium]|nr:oxidoreductase [Candidatus Binatia bacterium]